MERRKDDEVAVERGEKEDKESRKRKEKLNRGKDDREARRREQGGWEVRKSKGSGNLFGPIGELLLISPRDSLGLFRIGAVLCFPTLFG